jgi:dTMP kinase
MRRRGTFITLEGIDGTGKSTHIGLLSAHLRRAGYAVTVTREPGGTPAGETIREVLLKRAGAAIEPLAELALMYAARAQHIERVIRPALRAGRIVLSDRYNDASFAYQGFGRRLGIRAVRAFDRIICGRTQPDLTLLLDLDPAAALERTRGRKDGKSRFEAAGLQFQQRVRTGYLTIARHNPKRVRIIKSAKGVDEVQQEVRRVVDRWLAGKGKLPRRRRS